MPERVMRVLVCGGRDYDDPDCVHRTLDRLDDERGPFSVIIHGRCSGADACASSWAVDNQRWEWALGADWHRYEKRAGPIRNARMLKEGKPDLVIAFPGGRGTADMVRKAKTAGVEVVEVGS